MFNIQGKVNNFAITGLVLDGVTGGKNILVGIHKEVVNTLTFQNWTISGGSYSDSFTLVLQPTGQTDNAIANLAMSDITAKSGVVFKDANMFDLGGSITASVTIENIICDTVTFGSDKPEDEGSFIKLQGNPTTLTLKTFTIKSATANKFSFAQIDSKTLGTLTLEAWTLEAGNYTNDFSLCHLNKDAVLTDLYVKSFTVKS